MSFLDDILGVKDKIKKQILDDTSMGETTDDGWSNVDVRDLRKKGFSKREAEEVVREADYNAQQTYYENEEVYDNQDYDNDGYDY